MSTRIEMLNRALLRIGADALGTEADPGAPVHLAVYDSVLEYLAGVHPWSFFKETRRLVRIDAAPEAHFQYQFQMPPDRIAALRAVYPAAEIRKPTTAYTITGDRLLTDHPEIWVTFVKQRDPAYWVGEFREGFTLLLMSELALSIREDRPLRDSLRRDALGTPGEQPHGGIIGKAISSDNMAEPSVGIAGDYNPLIDVRS